MTPEQQKIPEDWYRGLKTVNHKTLRGKLEMKAFSIQKSDVARGMPIHRRRLPCWDYICTMHECTLKTAIKKFGYQTPDGLRKHFLSHHYYYDTRITCPFIACQAKFHRQAEILSHLRSRIHNLSHELISQIPQRTQG